jgi:hypothetical protein
VLVLVLPSLLFLLLLLGNDDDDDDGPNFKAITIRFEVSSLAFITNIFDRLLL